jgi:NAD(P)-dependent dehydrogenase (short-subunit alcohol dehydrogenase family)
VGASWLMKGKVALVTGANCGIGKETAAALAQRGALTVLACRNAEKAEQAAIDVRDLTGNDEVETVSVDLKDLQSVARCSDELVGRYQSIDLLVNNAGGYWDVRETTPQGFEQHFAVNYLSHYLLTRRLLDASEGRAPSRVVSVTSVGHRAVKRMNWDDLQFERGWTVSRAYGQSKLALILFTREIARRFGDLGVIAHAAHPGFVKSNFAEDGDTHGMQRLTVRLMTLFGVSSAVGAKTSVHLATSQDAGASNGGYWVRSKPRSPSKAARDADAARRLWDVSQQLLIEAGVTP